VSSKNLGWEITMKVNDIVSGLLLIIFAASMMAYTTTFPPFPGQKYGPSLFPRILGVGIIICGALLVRRGVALRTTGQSLAYIGDAYKPWRGWASVLMILGSIIFYIAFSNILGFVITAFIVIFALLWWFGNTVSQSLLIALVAVLAVDWFFGWLFRVPLPLGILPNGPAYALMNLIRGVK
jgi:putative tricarboxylic transport membrane protein